MTSANSSAPLSVPLVHTVAVRHAAKGNRVWCRTTGNFQCCLFSCHHHLQGGVSKLCCTYSLDQGLWTDDDGYTAAVAHVYRGCVLWCLLQALGYLSVNDTFDLNIVIRTAVFVDQPSSTSPSAASSSSSSISSSGGGSSSRVMTIGAGGAVTIQSDCESEFAEMQLKAERLLSAAALAQQQPTAEIRQQQQQQMAAAALVQPQSPQPQEQAGQQEAPCMVRR